MFDRDYHIGMRFREKSIKYLDQAIASKNVSEKKKAWRKYELCSVIADRHMGSYLHQGAKP